MEASHFLTGRHSLAWRLRVTFAGNVSPKIYLTKDVRRNDPGWGSEVFNRTIEQLELFLPTGHRIVLVGMEQYNFFVEAVQSLAAGSRHSEINAFWLCGKLPGQPVIEMWRVGEGKVVRQRKPFGMEWGGTATTGWRLGVVGSECVSRVVKG
jgi:hypothetical protein